MARLREAIGGAVPPARIASSAALFQSVTTSAWASVPIRSAVAADHEKSLEVFIKINNSAMILSEPFPCRLSNFCDVAADPVVNAGKGFCGLGIAQTCRGSPHLATTVFSGAVPWNSCTMAEKFAVAGSCVLKIAPPLE